MLKKFVVILIILSLLISEGCYSNQNGSTSDTNNKEKEEVVTEDNFIAASSIEILQTTADQLANGSYDFLSKNMKSGDYFVLPKGSKLRILETRDDKYTKCLVLDGKLHIGEEFWTFTLSFEYGSNIPFDLITQTDDLNGD